MAVAAMAAPMSSRLVSMGVLPNENPRIGSWTIDEPWAYARLMIHRGRSSRVKDDLTFTVPPFTWAVGAHVKNPSAVADRTRILSSVVGVSCSMTVLDIARTRRATLSLGSPGFVNGKLLITVV